MNQLILVLILFLCISQTKNKVLCRCAWVLIGLLIFQSMYEGYCNLILPSENTNNYRVRTPTPSCDSYGTSGQCTPIPGCTWGEASTPTCSSVAGGPDGDIARCEAVTNLSTNTACEAVMTECSGATDSANCQSSSGCAWFPETTLSGGEVQEAQCRNADASGPNLGTNTTPACEYAGGGEGGCRSVETGSSGDSLSPENWQSHIECNADTGATGNIEMQLIPTPGATPVPYDPSTNSTCKDANSDENPQVLSVTGCDIPFEGGQGQSCVEAKRGDPEACGTIGWKEEGDSPEGYTVVGMYGLENNYCAGDPCDLTDFTAGSDREKCCKNRMSCKSGVADRSEADNVLVEPTSISKQKCPADYVNAPSGAPWASGIDHHSKRVIRDEDKLHPDVICSSTICDLTRIIDNKRNPHIDFDKCCEIDATTSGSSSGSDLGVPCWTGDTVTESELEAIDPNGTLRGLDVNEWKDIIKCNSDGTYNPTSLSSNPLTHPVQHYCSDGYHYENPPSTWELDSPFNEGSWWLNASQRANRCCHHENKNDCSVVFGVV